MLSASTEHDKLQNQPAESGAENNTYVHIQGHILRRKDLTANQKMVYGLIFGLSNKTGFCWASNEAMAEILGCATRTAAESVSVLAELRLIRLYTTFADESRVIKHRKIYICPSLPDEQNPTGGESPECRNCTRTDAEIALGTDAISALNNKPSYNKSYSEKDPCTFDPDFINKYFGELSEITKTDNRFILDQARPLKNWPRIWIRPDRFMAVLKDYKDSGITEGGVVKALDIMQDMLAPQNRGFTKAGKAFETPAYKYLSTFIKKQIMEDKSTENHYKKSKPDERRPYNGWGTPK